MHPPTAPFPPPSSAAVPAADDDDFDDDDDDDDMDMYDDEDPPSSAVASAPPPSADPTSSPSSSTDDDDRLLPSNGASAAPPTPSAPVLSLAATPETKRPRIDEEARRSFSSIEERRLFQRLWTDEDEIVILQGFYEFTSQRGTTHHAHQHDTGPFYEQIKRRLQLDFSKNQLVEKIRRLKKKYRNVVTRMASARDFAFKSPHEKALYDIASKIWSASTGKKGFDHDDDDLNDIEPQQALDLMRGRRGVKRPATPIIAVDSVPVEVKALPAIPVSVTPPVPVVAKTEADAPMNSVVEETIKNCFSPLVKDLLQYVIGGAGNCGIPNGSLMTMGLMPLGFSGSLTGLGVKDAALDERWRKQQILELEVYSKRLDLEQELIKVKLDELRSLG